MTTDTKLTGRKPRRRLGDDQRAEIIDAMRADLIDAWQAAVSDMDTAYRDMIEARGTLDRESTRMDRREAGVSLGVEGKNAEERKARLTLALADDTHYEESRERMSKARLQALDAERRIAVARERCRIYRVRVETERD